MSLDSLNSLLDASLDDLADLPEFKPFPAGAHRVMISWAEKEINKKPAVELNLKMLETLELSNPSDEAPKPGDTASVAYIFKNNDGSANEISQGKFKKILKELRDSFVLNTSSNREILEQTQNAECVVVTSVRENKNNGTKNLDVVRISAV